MNAPSRAAAAARRRASWRKSLRRNYALYLMLLAPMTCLVLFKYAPIYGIQIAFRNYSIANGIWNSPWVGLKYVNRFFNDYRFWRVLRNTLSIGVYSLATFLLPIVLAILLHYLPSRRVRKGIQLISYMPHFISTVVMAGMILQFLDARSGLLNMLLRLLGAEAVNFMLYPQYFYHIYIWSGVWQSIGYSAIIYIAALTSVSEELHEAAIVDGASILRRIWHVDLPAILPTAVIMLILRCGSLFSVDFEKVFLLQNNLNLEVSEVVSTLVYKQGLASAMPQYSYSTAIGLFVSVVNCVLLYVVNKGAKVIGGHSLW